MELRFMTPTEVWEGYNPVKDPLETSIISSREDGNFVINEIFFTSETLPSGRVRVLLRIFFDRRWSDSRAAILILPNLEEKMDYSALARMLVSEGYVVCLCDYCGADDDEDKRTVIPGEISYARYPECIRHLYELTSDARHTPWFQWSKIARRAITMLQEHVLVDKNKIGVLGTGNGAQIAWQTAGIDARVAALVAVDGGGYIWCKNKPRFAGGNLPSDDTERAFSTGAGAETYARMVTCPTCFMVSSNSTYFDADRAGDIFSLVPSKCKRLIIDKGAVTQLSERSINVMIKWLRSNFALDGEKEPQPELSFECVENDLYIKLYTDKRAIVRTVYYCSGSVLPMARDWRALADEQKTEKHEYTLRVPVENADDIIVAFADVTYPDGSVSCTPISHVIPSKLGVSSDSIGKAPRSKLIYTSDSGLTLFSARTNDIILKDGLLRIEEGPFGIKGICTQSGGLYFILGSVEIEHLGKDAILHFDACSPEKRELTVTLTAFPDLKKYHCTAKLEGGEFWQKILLRPSDFKSDEGRTYVPGEFGAEFSLADCANVLFNNFLWI